VPPHEGCRLPLNIGFLPLPVDPISKAMTHPLRSTGITPLQHYKETDSPPQLDSDEAAMTYERFIRCGSAKPVANYYEAVRPSPAHRYFRPRGWSRLCLFPWHRRPGSHVPYKSTTGIGAGLIARDRPPLDRVGVGSSLTVVAWPARPRL
jgi:hypothetical protein